MPLSGVSHNAAKTQRALRWERRCTLEALNNGMRSRLCNAFVCVQSCALKA